MLRTKFLPCPSSSTVVPDMLLHWFVFVCVMSVASVYVILNSVSPHSLQVAIMIAAHNQERCYLVLTMMSWRVAWSSPHSDLESVLVSCLCSSADPPVCHQQHLDMPWSETISINNATYSTYSTLRIFFRNIVLYEFLSRFCLINSLLNMLLMWLTTHMR